LRHRPAELSRRRQSRHFRPFGDTPPIQIHGIFYWFPVLPEGVRYIGKLMALDPLERELMAVEADCVRDFRVAAVLFA